MLKHQLFFLSVLTLIYLGASPALSKCVEGDCLNGTGTYHYVRGKKYVGEWKDGKKHGQGTYTYPDGKQYVGEFRNRKKNGQGMEIYPDGTKYEGEFKGGKPHGQGTFTNTDGSWYKGEFVKGEPPDFRYRTYSAKKRTGPETEQAATGKPEAVEVPGSDESDTSPEGAAPAEVEATADQEKASAGEADK